MKIALRDGLPFAGARVTWRARRVRLPSVLLDTGAAGTVLAVDRLLKAGLTMDPGDPVRRIRGVGGSELVFEKAVDTLEVGRFRADGVRVEIGALDYGFDLDGILGTDFLVCVKARIDFASLELDGSP